MKVLVTGAAGFIGANVVRELLADGQQVKCFVRASSGMANLNDIAKHVEIAFGDIRDERSLRRAMEGCDRVYHGAAMFTLGSAWNEFLDHNVNGTRTVCRVCAEQRVERLVYTSSTAAVGLATGPEPADEETVWNLHTYGIPYLTTKHLAETEVLRAVARGLDAVIVNPSSPLGPWDSKPTPTGKLVLDLMRGKMSVLPEVGLPFVHVKDVARGHLLAMEKGQRGERYILHGETLPMRHLAEAVCRLASTRMPWLPVSQFMLKAIAAMRHVLPGVAYPKLNWVVPLLGRMEFSNRKSIEKLGMTYQPVEQAIRDAVNYFFDKNFAPRPASPVTIRLEAPHPAPALAALPKPAPREAEALAASHSAPQR